MASTNSGATTVTVACKHPHGLKLRLFEMVERTEVTHGGTRTIKVAQERHDTVTIKGNAHPQNRAPNATISHGFALTHGVPKEFWDAWVEQNKDSDLVKNGLIFAHAGAANTEAESREKESVKSGLERLDPDNLPRGIAKADEQAAA